MALFLEDSEKVTQRQIEIPFKAKQTFKAMEKLYGPYEDKVEGGHVLKALASDKQYNKKGDKSSKNGKTGTTDSVSVEDAKKRLERMDKFAPNSPQYQMYGGQLGHDIYDKGIKRARAVNTVSPVKPVLPTAQGATKPSGVETKEISKPNGKITYTLDKIAEHTQKSKKKIYITEEQLTRIKQYQQDLQLLREYPHYFAEFMADKYLIDDWDEEPYSTLYDLCEYVFGGIEEGDSPDVIDKGKEELYNYILNDNKLAIFVHRYIEDYIAPRKYKQDIVDRYENGENLRDINWKEKRNQFQVTNQYGSPMTYLKK